MEKDRHLAVVGEHREKQGSIPSLGQSVRGL